MRPPGPPSRPLVHDATGAQSDRAGEGVLPDRRPGPSTTKDSPRTLSTDDPIKIRSLVLGRRPHGDVVGSRHSTMLVTLIADDLTGACDAGAPFAGRAPVGVFVAPTSPGPEWTVAAVDTESRELLAADAAAATQAAVGRLGARLPGGLLFKKIDSTLRGPIGAELEALLAVSGRQVALVCPAFPAQGRTVSAGTLLVNERPAHESPIARDPAYPGSTSDVAEIVRRGTVRPVSLVPLERVRGDNAALVRTL